MRPSTHCAIAWCGTEPECARSCCAAALSRSQDWLLNECCRALVVLEVDTKKNETDGPYIAFRNHPIITHSLHGIVCLASCIAKGSQPAPYVNVNENDSVFD